MKQPGILQAFLLILAVLAGCFLTFMVEEARLRKQEAKAVILEKEKAILEYKYKDTLKMVLGWNLNLVASSNKRIDSLTAITEREQKERVIIRMIKPEILTSEEVLARLKSHYHNYNPPK